MHITRKKAALDKVAAFVAKGLSVEEALDQLKADPKNYTAAELKELAAAQAELGGEDEGEGDDHVLTDADFIANPGLAEQGLKVGDTVKVPKGPAVLTSTTNPPLKKQPEEQQPQQQQEPEPAPGAEGQPNVSKYDYRNLTGKSFKDYVTMVGDRNYGVFDEETGHVSAVVPKLKENQMYDFAEYAVDVVMKDRFPGMAGSPRDFNGVKIKGDVLKVTRIPLYMAHEMNAQILNAHSLSGKGKYLLLAQKR